MKHLLDPKHTDPARLQRERDKAKELKKTRWWKEKIATGKCHYCGGTFKSAELTMDHITPIARGGVTAKDNVVPACKACNTTKKLDTPLDDAFAAIEAERKARETQD